MQRIKVVIIDDDLFLCGLLELFFKKEYNQVIDITGIANDGRDGLNLILKSKPDVILLDIAMPHKDGLDILREIRRLNETRQIICIFISSIGSCNVLSEITKEGGDYFYLKPFDMHSLFNTISETYRKKNGSRNFMPVNLGENTQAKIEDTSVQELFVYEEAQIQHQPQSQSQSQSQVQNALNSAETNDISLFLKNIGINQISKGYYFLKHAIKLCIQNKNYLDGITKRLYPTIAKDYNTTNSRVERSIRHLLEKAWENGAGQRYALMIGLPEECTYKRPANSAFIYQAVEHIESGRCKNIIKSK